MTQMREFGEINEGQLTHEQIEKRAYEIYLQHSHEQGDPLEDWRIAEEALKQERRKCESQKRKTVVAG